jgi:hypothetical protein
MAFEVISPEEFQETHGYFMENGSWYPRVTKIVDIKAKPALYRFYGRMESFAAGEKMKKLSAEEGTAIHEAAEAVFLGKEPELTAKTAPSIEAFKKFITEKNIRVFPEYVETRLWSDDHRYAGTLDAVAEIDGRVGVLDIKTSLEIYRDYCLQTSAYVAAMKARVPELETRWILRIDQAQPCLQCGALLRTKGGNRKVRTTSGNAFMRACSHRWGPLTGFIELKEFPDWEHDFEAFLGAKRLWEWENEAMLKTIGYLK